MKSYLVIGMGRFGSSVAVELYQRKNDVLVVDAHEENVVGLVDLVSDVIIGDAKDETVLRSLDIDSFDCVIVAMAGTVEDSVLTTIMLKEMGAKMIVCKAQNERHANILTRLGADKIIHPESDMGKRVAQLLTRKNIIDYLELSPKYSLMEITTPAKWVNKSIVDNNLRKKYGITVIAIHNTATEKMQFSPSGDVMLRHADVLTVIGLKEDILKIRAL